jgi:hypothetical protein
VTGLTAALQYGLDVAVESNVLRHGGGRQEGTGKRYQ